MKQNKPRNEKDLLYLINHLGRVINRLKPIETTEKIGDFYLMLWKEREELLRHKKATGNETEQYQKKERYLEIGTE